MFIVGLLENVYPQQKLRNEIIILYHDLADHEENFLRRRTEGLENESLF